MLRNRNRNNGHLLRNRGNPVPKRTPRNQWRCGPNAISCVYVSSSPSASSRLRKKSRDTTWSLRDQRETRKSSAPLCWSVSGFNRCLNKLACLCKGHRRSSLFCSLTSRLVTLPPQKPTSLSLNLAIFPTLVLLGSSFI